jgi:hypothetical protein
MFAVAKSSTIGQPNGPLPHLLPWLLTGMNQDMFVHPGRYLSLNFSKQPSVHQHESVGWAVKNMETSLLANDRYVKGPAMNSHRNRSYGMFPAQTVAEELRKLVTVDIGCKIDHAGAARLRGLGKECGYSGLRTEGVLLGDDL